MSLSILNKLKIHLHFHTRGDVPNISLWEIFWSHAQDMRDLSIFERAEAYALSFGDTEIRYAHVEISFRFVDVVKAGCFNQIETALTYDELNNSDYRIAASATGDSTFFMPRLYTSTQYITYEIDWPEGEVLNMIRFAAENRQKRFLHGIFQTFLVPTPPDNDTWFCAQYIASILKSGGMMNSINPSEMTGDLIIAFIQKFYNAFLTTEPGRAAAVERSVLKAPKSATQSKSLTPGPSFQIEDQV